MDEASPEEILTISILINILLSEMTSGNKYACIFSLACPFVTVWLSFPRCRVRSPSPHVTLSLRPGSLPKRSRLPSCCDLGYFLLLLFPFFFLMEQMAKQEGTPEPPSASAPAEGLMEMGRAARGPGARHALARPLLDLHNYNERYW